jgi:hypothetical protein
VWRACRRFFAALPPAAAVSLLEKLLTVCENSLRVKLYNELWIVMTMYAPARPSQLPAAGVTHHLGDPMELTRVLPGSTWISSSACCCSARRC